jgi:hypothetical protein
MAAPKGSSVMQTMLKRLAEDERGRGTTKAAETVGTMAPNLEKVAVR